MARTFSLNNNLVYPSNSNGTAPVTTIPFTMACWGRFSVTSVQLCMSMANAAGAWYGLGVGYSTAGRIGSIAADGGGDALCETTTGITTSTWHHLCAVYTSATSRAVYIDAGSVGTNATSKTIASLVLLAIGSQRYANETSYNPVATGQLAEVAIWNVALGTSEITALARGTPPYRIRPDAIAGYWPIYGLDSPERDWKPGILSATRYPMTLVGTPALYGGHAPVVRIIRPVIAPLIEEAGAETTTSRLIPDSIAASTNLTGAVSAIQEDPDADDASWLTATSATAVTDLRVTFSNPPADPSGAQNFRYLLRKTTGAPNPTITAELRQSDTLRKTLTAAGTAITSTTGTVIQGDWNVSDLVTVLDGSDVECRIVSVVGSSASVPGALPAYNSSGTYLPNATMPATRDIVVPTHSSGDLLILVVGMQNADSGNRGVLATINTANWTQLGGVGNTYGGNQNATLGVGWKIGNGSESVVNITTTGGTTTDSISARVHRFTAADGFADTPVQNISSAGTGASAITMPTVAVPSTNCLAIVCAASDQESVYSTPTGESNGSWVINAQDPTTLGGDSSIAILSSDQSGGTTISGGTMAFTLATVGVVVGFAVVPATIPGAAVNTVEIGAIEWNATHLIPAAPSGIPIKLMTYRRRWLM